LLTPTRSRKAYLASFVAFGLIQAYVLVLSFYLVARAFGQSSGWDELSSPTVIGWIGHIFTTNTGLIILALASTWGLYIVSSLMYLDPWHMIHSFPQYLFLASSYCNVLNVYAFCNWHDVSWGTKGSDAVETMPSATTKKTKEGRVLEEEIVEKKDLDLQFEEIVRRCLKPLEVQEEKEQKSLDDSYKSFRTRLISAWILLNAAVAVFVTSSSFDWVGPTSTERTAWYFRFILMSTAALAFFRFIGFCWFLGRSAICCCFNKR
jgi:chitin synthase